MLSIASWSRQQVAHFDQRARDAARRPDKAHYYGVAAGLSAADNAADAAKRLAQGLIGYRGAALLAFANGVSTGEDMHHAVEAFVQAAAS